MTILVKSNDILDLPINLVNTLTLLEEIPTDGHSPMKFLCKDDRVYFCKYRSGFSLNGNEIDFLAYEVICHFLLKHFKIPTPEIALVQLVKDSFEPKDLKLNKKYAKPGLICFGSQEVKGANLITGLELAKNRRDFNRYLNPDDLIRIACFDLWIGNTDRGRDENFNLLSHSYLGKQRILAFDHGFAFHGESGLRTFNPEWPLETQTSLGRTTFYKSIVKHIHTRDRIREAENFVNWMSESVESVVNEAFAGLPKSWLTPPNLKNRILDFLENKSRLERIKAEVLLSLRLRK